MPVVPRSWLHKYEIRQARPPLKPANILPGMADSHLPVIEMVAKSLGVSLGVPLRSTPPVAENTKTVPVVGLVT